MEFALFIIMRIRLRFRGGNQPFLSRNKHNRQLGGEMGGDKICN